MPFPAIQREERMDDGTYVLEWMALEEERTTNFTVFWCRSPPLWPKCNSDINWRVIPKNTTKFEFKSNESLKFAVSVNREFGDSGMSWDKSMMIPDSGDFVFSIEPSLFGGRGIVKTKSKIILYEIEVVKLQMKGKK